MKLLRLFVAFAAVLALAGCGIQPTGVVPAGDAPGGFQLGAPRPQITLYFVYAGQLSPVQRAWARDANPTTVLTELFGGPTRTEEQEGFYSTLSPGRPVTVDTSAQPVTVTVSESMKLLYPVGLQQVVCTVSASLAASGQPVGKGITVVASDTKLESLYCN
ncbi:hypothetical protein G3I59_02485 [Amycolatopsis rubida]|uniref:GerMN domain-containing protein n=1 Tax=Amycolatopsis rubida TaxID=112413 RepID=A0ABX0BGX4_9PSEU|nr:MULTISPECIES: hypothetical protein [Amycolatopsis]MYW89525.1 hypothetical protein [Amycolatopsis rubida]NEC54502.1 hypothetical protein [Amycolatopsis rubida]OAP25269.1 hypothetical protein A4R44_03652 [Amycolatopsis sp. M39]